MCGEGEAGAAAAGESRARRTGPCQGGQHHVDLGAHVPRRRLEVVAHQRPDVLPATGGERRGEAMGVACDGPVVRHRCAPRPVHRRRRQGHARPDDDGSQRGKTRHALHVFPATRGHRRSARQEPRHVAADRRAHLGEALDRPVESPQPRRGTNRRRGVTRATAQPGTGGNPFHQIDLERRFHTGRGGQRLDSPDGQVAGVGWHLAGAAASVALLVNTQAGTRRFHGPHRQRVVERHGDHERFDLVVTVSASAEDRQRQVELRRSLERQRNWKGRLHAVAIRGHPPVLMAEGLIPHVSRRRASPREQLHADSSAWNSPMEHRTPLPPEPAL